MQLTSEGYFWLSSNKISRGFPALCKTHALPSSPVLVVVPLSFKQYAKSDLHSSMSIRDIKMI